MQQSFTTLIIVILAALLLAVCAAWVHGIVLAFSASVLLGIICIFFQFPFVIFGLAYWLTGVDLARRIVDALPMIFS